MVFCLTLAKKFLGEPFGVAENFGYRKNLFAVGNFLSHSTEKLRKGTLPGFRKSLVSELFILKRGEGYRDFPS